MGRAILTLAVLQARHALSLRRVWMPVLLLAVPPAILALIRWKSGAPTEEDLFASAWRFYLLYPQTILILLSILTCGTLFAQELEGRTLTYLWTRPLPKAVIFWGQYLGAAAVTAGLTAVSLAVSHAIAGFVGGFRFLAAFWAASAGGAFAYGAIFLALGALAPRRALVIGAVYALGVEFGLSFVPAVVNTWTAAHHVRGLARAILDLTLPANLPPHLMAETLGGSLLGLAVIAVVGLAAAGALLTWREYPVTTE